MRGWVEVAPDNGDYFAGLLVLGLSTCAVGSFAQWCVSAARSHQFRPVQLI